jgi:hypothetical protein
MSNEEILEEIYIEIHKLGLFNEFCEKVNFLQKKESKTSHYDIAQNVYQEMITQRD